MTINTSSLIQESTLNRMVQLAFRGQNQDPDLLDSALGVLSKCGLTAEQNAKITAILKNVPSDNAGQATTEMKERILAVLSGKDLLLEVAPNEKVSFSPGPKIIPMNQICFSNVQTSVYIDHLLDDIIQTLFFQCHFTCEWESIGALACVNKHYNLCATAYWKQFDLTLFCPELTILDAKTQGITIDDEPIIDKLAILKCFKNLVSHVENNEGLTLLTMAKGLTLNQLVEIAAKGGMTVNVRWNRILQELGDVPVEQTYVILITNCVFLESRNKSYALQKECAARHGCEMPTIQEYVALCVFTNKCFQKCVYGQNPSTIGRSSTHVGGYPLFVGDCAPAELLANFSLINFDCESYGTGGRRKF